MKLGAFAVCLTFASLVLGSSNVGSFKTEQVLPRGVSSINTQHGSTSILARKGSESIVPSSELKHGRYLKIKKIGQGSFGLVYKASDKQEKVKVALKRIRIDDEDSEFVSCYAREIFILRQLKHPNIIRLYGAFFNEWRLTLVFEFVAGTIEGYLAKQNLPLSDEPRKRITEEQSEVIKALMYQLLQGLVYLHEKHVIHRDLKPANLLVSRDGVLKIADLGLALVETPGRKKIARGTFIYRSPDVILGNNLYSYASDMWAVGLIFAKLVNGRSIVSQRLVLADIRNILGNLDKKSKVFYNKVFDDLDKESKEECNRLLGNLPDSDELHWDTIKTYGRGGLETAVPALDRSGMNLLKKMLRYHPDDRISASAALKHPYFDSVRHKFIYKTV